MSIKDFSVHMRVGMSECLDTGKYSDLAVKCSNGDIYNVHKLVLCSQSNVFRNACDPGKNFKEANEGVIHMNEDSPEIVKALLEFLYRFDYSVPEDSGMLFHVQAYAMGEIYAVGGMKDLAKARFRNNALVSWACPTFPPAVKAIYNTTPETDRGLRDVAVEVAAAHVEDLLNDESYRNTMDEVGPFGKDLARALYESRSVETKKNGVYGCPDGCGQDVEMVLPTNLTYIHCISCGQRNKCSYWEDRERT